ncbi:similar to Fanconi anemia, complementation group E (predicted), isoform CRA_c [Rattus norvegicus]|uniref:Similar to Fanconi anemia, complementation group E (Predicted), isoform CRA_c n=1 Tax=Rattus norvegicus TaxID=10116 RepID=A6JJQ4_RAT|nr:similar to Fanconi anemia, complementation group E (predicted), isoform CRA_c [Rattus norvegicus]
MLSHVPLHAGGDDLGALQCLDAEALQRGAGSHHLHGLCQADADGDDQVPGQHLTAAESGPGCGPRAQHHLPEEVPAGSPETSGPLTTHTPGCAGAILSPQRAERRPWLLLHS